MNPKEKNSLQSIERAIDNDFGIETDFRDYDSKLVISHDVPNIDVISMEQYIKIFKLLKPSQSLAINIKSDGLFNLIQGFTDEIKHSNYFLFDMSGPEMWKYISMGIPVYTRMSEYEQEPLFFQESAGVWLDAFEGRWYQESLINDLLSKNKKIVFVSRELHNQSYDEQWDFIKRNEFDKNPLVAICTDFPIEAKGFFYV